MKKVIIMGAAGKDFHVFNTCYRNNKNCQVIAFTATQIPNIDDRKYPPELAGPLYPQGIFIYSERKLTWLIKLHQVDEVIFSYSDVSYEYVKERQKRVEATGAVFKTFDVEPTLIHSTKPVVAVCAVRTGAGKSPASRAVIKELQKLGKKVVAIRHPMPYGDLVKQEVQRFATLEDLKNHNCTIEEMEEYEPHIKNGVIVYAGVDYEKILRAAEKEADVILWDGGNNDTPCIKTNIQKHNPKAKVLKADIEFHADDPSKIKDKRVLVIEDGPTLTQGGMKYGAGILAARKYGAREIIDPRSFAVGTIKEAFETYDVGPLLPALGYGEKQQKELEETINRSHAESLVIATPIDLSRIIQLTIPYTRVTYELKEIESGSLRSILSDL